MIIETPMKGLQNELAEEVRQFSLLEPIAVYHEIDVLDGRFWHTVRVVTGEKYASERVCGASGTEEYWEQKRLDKRAAKLACYRALCYLAESKQPWGSLTGVRPATLLRQLEKKGQENLFVDYYGVDPHKYNLAKQIINVQDTAMAQIEPDSICLYIGIPFCVTRCSYCSFPGRIAKKGEMEAYADALLLEMDAARESTRGRTIAAVYIGGGTPTSLPLPLLEKLLKKLEEFGGIKEITLEAGRPDTLDTDKLACAMQHGVNRLCINPQTMSDETLVRIGRSHTAQAVEDAFSLAQSIGFSHINMDIIAGLPGETTEDFAHTLSKIRELSPSSFTCHTLSIKRGSRLQSEQHLLCDAKTVGVMVEMARDTACGMGMEPYYMYRQKYMAGNLENVGYAKPGCACVYNIAMMDEMLSVMALGVGSVGKLLWGNLIVRKPNPRDLYVYLDRLPNILEQKRGFFCIDNGNTRVYNNPNDDDEDRGTI